MLENQITSNTSLQEPTSPGPRIDGFVSVNASSREPWSRRWARVHNRRIVAHELDRLLGVDSRPDLAVTYGLTLAGESR